MTARSYRQFCGIAHALDLVGERWALLVVRELILGPKRFTDLLNGLSGIGTNILSARLKQLEEGGVVRRRLLPPPAASTVYELTEYGRELEEILLALGRWGAKTMGLRGPDQALKPEWLAVALLAFVHREAAEGLRDTYELRLGPATFHARAEDGAVTIRSGPAANPDLVVETDEETLIALLGGVLAAAEATAAGTLRIEGDEDALGRLVAIFRFPQPEAVSP
jgi:DNA-binding HxlR family transcriptional regulator